MSYDGFSSFTSNNELDWPFNPSYGSSQSTQATEVSEFSNSGVAAPQVREHTRALGNAGRIPFQSFSYASTTFCCLKFPDMRSFRLLI